MMNLLLTKEKKITLHWLFMALHLLAAEPSLRKKAAASEYLSQDKKMDKYKMIM